MTETMTLLLNIIGVLVIFVITILCYFLKCILDQMKELNNKLLSVVTNQEWHHEAIKDLQSKVRNLEGIKFNPNKHEVEL